MSQEAEQYGSVEHIESPRTTFTFHSETINTILNTAINEQTYSSALARKVLNGEEPYASLFCQLDAQATQAVAPLSATVTLVSQPQRKPGRPPGSGTYGRCLKGVDSRSKGAPEFVAIDEQPNDEIVHALRLGEAQRATH